jgi:hypothetical protein
MFSVPFWFRFFETASERELVEPDMGVEVPLAVSCVGHFHL